MLIIIISIIIIVCRSMQMELWTSRISNVVTITTVLHVRISLIKATLQSVDKSVCLVGISNILVNQFDAK